MSPEEFQRIKEAEKEHLRSLKKLKNAVRVLKRQQRVNDALDNVANASQSALDTHQEMIDRLAMDTAQQEARMEIALEHAKQPESTAPAPPSLEQLEEDMVAERARQLLAQMKLEMGVPLDTPDTSAERKEVTKTASRAQATTPTKQAPQPPVSPSPPDALPDKTIGRMK